MNKSIFFLNVCMHIDHDIIDELQNLNSRLKSNLVPLKYGKR